MRPRSAGRRAFALTFGAIVWAVALLPAALLVPIYGGSASSSSSGTTSTTSTLVGENGTGALTIVALPAVLAVIVALALYWKCSRGSRMGEWLAWIAIGLLGVFIFLSAMTIGLFALPVALLLGWAARLTSVSSAPGGLISSSARHSRNPAVHDDTP